MDLGLFAPHIARAIITHLEECGVEPINVMFCAKNNSCDEVVQRANHDGVITINVSKRAVKNLTFGPLGITMTLSFDGVPRDVVFMPEDLLSIEIPINGSEEMRWHYMLRDIDDQLSLLSGNMDSKCSVCSVHEDSPKT